MSLEPKKKAAQRVNHRSMILGMLLKAGRLGCTSQELGQVTWRFSARIYDLRQKGFIIETLEREGTDTVIFVLQSPKPAPEQAELFNAGNR